MIKGGEFLEKQDWIDIVNLYLDQNWNWADWTLFFVSVISPLIMLSSVIFAWRATKISKQATELNFEMFKRQIEDYEKSFWPVFKVESVQASSDIVRIKLHNKSHNSISVTNIATTDNIEHFEKKEPNESVITMKFLGEFKENDQIKVWLYYTTLNHKFYSSKIIFRIVGGSVVIEDYNIKERN